MNETQKFYRYIIMKILILFAALSVSFVGCSTINKYFGMENDNEIEQTVEFIIESQTGVNVDLTPENSLHYRPHHVVI